MPIFKLLTKRTQKREMCLNQLTIMNNQSNLSCLPKLSKTGYVSSTDEKSIAFAGNKPVSCKGMFSRRCENVPLSICCMTLHRSCPVNYTCLADAGPNPDYGYTNFDHMGWSLVMSFQLLTMDFWENIYNKVGIVRVVNS